MTISLSLSPIPCSKQHHHVFDVLLVDLHDLQLLQYQVGQADRRLVEVQSPLLPAHDVAHVQLVEEDVDVGPLVTGVVVDLPAQHETRRQSRRLRLVPHVLEEELVYRLLLLVVGGEIEICQDPVHRLLEVLMDRAVDAKRHRSQKPQTDPVLLGCLDDLQRLSYELFVSELHLLRRPPSF